MWFKRRKLNENDCDKAIYENKEQVRCSLTGAIRNKETCIKKCPRYNARSNSSKK